MNGRGHRLTAIAFGLSICSAYASGTIELDYPAEPLIVLAVFMAGIIAGSSAPDWLELPIIIKGNTVGRIIPHRTITHWFPIWMALGWWIWNQEFAWQVEVGALGFIASALLHILMDGLSKSGVPLFLPFASYRKKISLYSTGKLSEFFAVVTVMSLFIFSCLIMLKLDI